MTINEYVTAAIGRFGITPEEIEFLIADKGLDPEDTVNDSNRIEVKTAIYWYIPSLIAGLSDVSEGDYSIKYNVAGIKAWFTLLARELGLDDVLSPAPIIRDRSYLW